MICAIAGTTALATASCMLAPNGKDTLDNEFPGQGPFENVQVGQDASIFPNYSIAFTSKNDLEMNRVYRDPGKLKYPVQIAQESNLDYFKEGLARVFPREANDIEKMQAATRKSYILTTGSAEYNRTLGRVPLLDGTYRYYFTYGEMITKLTD